MVWNTSIKIGQLSLAISRRTYRAEVTVKSVVTGGRRTVIYALLAAHPLPAWSLHKAELGQW